MNSYHSRSKPYQVGQTDPYKVSRTRIELFTQCQRCFWLDERLKIKRPAGPPFSLNKAVDQLLKKEFDYYRVKKEPHPVMVKNKVDAIPFAHEDLEKWRNNFSGVATLHKPTNLQVFGAIDDVWVDPSGNLIVVDYKATSKPSEVSLDADWQNSYKRQIEVYQWLLRQNGFKVSDRAYFVYVNGKLDGDGFYEKLEFTTKLLPYDGSDKWIEKTLSEMKDCLEGDIPPVGVAAMGGPCDYCEYAKKRTDITLKALQRNI
jgi:CRISPR/Cas system-associated exonuclease Cas4 (RecB family)